MLDDEIVCLGSRSGTVPQQHPVTGERDPALDLKLDLITVQGILMHVEGSSGAEPYSMLFRRVDTPVVQIGRRSGYELDRRSLDDQTSAMFRCAVVSRKHAKIAFSDGGHVRPFLLRMSRIANKCFTGLHHRPWIPSRNSHS